jgi:uroporphyrin-3 C-methyltransferase
VTDDATPPALPVTATPAPAARGLARGWAIVAGVLALIAVAGLALAWATHQRLQTIEQELVRRQQDSQNQATEARMLARQAQDAAREAAAKVTLLDARVAENTLQRTQIEELMQSLARSRDENVVADVEAAVRVALQQSAITGSVEPLVAALKQADERLARFNQPRLERVRRAVARDLDKVKAAGVADLSTLAIRLDEAVRQVDELPLLAVAELRKPAAPAPRAGSKPGASAGADSPLWGERVDAWWHGLTSAVWDEVRSLVRVTRIDHPEAVLAAPDQAFFVRENLKLRLLNARLGLLSRQFETAQSDLRDAQAMLERYFDRNARRVQSTTELVRQVAQQARLITLPRPDETLAALSAAAAGR